MSQSRNVLLETLELQLQFVWCEDRYHHELAVPHQGGWLRVLTSVEGTHQDPWPASPPLQSLHLERRDDRDIALLVGMAGQGHWSASVQFESEDVLTFDLACRLRGPVGPLGSSYQAASLPRPHGPAWRVWTNADGTESLEIRAWSAVVGTTLRSTPEALAIGPEVTADQAPRTLRWGYQIQRYR